MLTFIIVVLAILFGFCVVMWIVGITENANVTEVMSMHTYFRLCKERRVFDIDSAMGVGYYREDDNLRDWVIPRWTWYPIFTAILIGNATHKDVI